MLGRKKEAARADDPDAPQCPLELQYLWNWFEEVSGGIASAGFGYAVITWESLLAWSTLSALILEPWEAQALVMLSRQRAAVLSEASKTTPPAPARGPKPKQKGRVTKQHGRQQR